MVKVRANLPTSLVSMYVQQVDPRTETEDFEAFFAAFRPRVAGMARRFVADEAVIDDVVQEVMARALRAGLYREATRDPWPWLATVTRHLCHDVHRRAARWSFTDVEDVPPAGDASLPPETFVLGAVEAARVRATLAEVSPRQRRLLVEHHLDGRACEDIAAAEGTTVQAVKAALARARGAFRTRFEARPAFLPGLTAALGTRLRAARAGVAGWLPVGPRPGFAGALAALLAFGIVAPSSPASPAGPFSPGDGVERVQAVAPATGGPAGDFPAGDRPAADAPASSGESGTTPPAAPGDTPAGGPDASSPTGASGTETPESPPAGDDAGLVDDLGDAVDDTVDDLVDPVDGALPPVPDTGLELPGADVGGTVDSLTEELTGTLDGLLGGL